MSDYVLEREKTSKIREINNAKNIDRNLIRCRIAKDGWFMISAHDYYGD